MRHSLRNLERDSPVLHTSSILAADSFRVSEYHLECVRRMHCPTIGWDAYVNYVQRKNTESALAQGSCRTHAQQLSESLRQPAAHFRASNALSSMAHYMCNEV